MITRYHLINPEIVIISKSITFAISSYKRFTNKHIPLSNKEFEKLLTNDYFDVKKTGLIKGDDVSHDEFVEFCSNNGVGYTTFQKEEIILDNPEQNLYLRINEGDIFE